MQQISEDIQAMACADLIPEKAEAFAHRHGLQAQSIGSMLSNDDIERVINLTIPAAHVEANLKIIAAGIHVYSAKPFTQNREGGRRILWAANSHRVRVGYAPDTAHRVGTSEIMTIVIHFYHGSDFCPR